MKLPGPSDFVWATGIEDTFITVPHPITGRILDEYALTEHYERWEEDLSLIGELGVTAARYGIPWHRVNPRPGVFDWTWTDKVLDRMVNKHRVEPIIDLVHYGTPSWMEQSFFDDAYPDLVAEYAGAFAARYRGLCYWYTPLNEPRVNAWYAGRLGWWPPYGRGWRAFARLLVQLCRGICNTQRVIEAIESGATFVHVDASDLYAAEDPADGEAVAQAQLRQELVYLALDLVTGRVDPKHSLREWLSRCAIPDSDLEWFQRNQVRPHIIGFNMYPMFSRKIVRRDRSGGIRVVIRSCWSDTLFEIGRQYSERYAPLPIMITETACSGSIGRRLHWIEDSTATAKKLRDSGFPLVGYTFWPLYSLVAWAYRNSSRDIGQYLLHMGLWDLSPGPTGLERVHTPAADAFKRATRTM